MRQKIGVKTLASENPPAALALAAAASGLLRSARFAQEVRGARDALIVLFDRARNSSP
jgi:hypothetical protein